MSTIRISSVLLIMAWLYCVSAQSVTLPKDISSWEISGGMAARNQNKGWNASVHWIQKGSNQYQIRLYGPIGSGSILIIKKGNIVTIRDGNHTSSSSNPSVLLEKKTGVSLPVNHLYYWVRGLPAPGKVEGIRKDSNNRLAILKQAGYVIEYKAYTANQELALPTQIRLQKGNLVVKFIIRRWKY